MKKIILTLLLSSALTGCETFNEAWKATTDFVKGPVVAEAEGVYLEEELYSSGTGRCLSRYNNYSAVIQYQVSNCPKNLSVPYIVKGISSVDLDDIQSFGDFQPKTLAYNTDTAQAFYLELKPADDPMESSRIYAIFTEKELKNRGAPSGFVKKDGVSRLKEKDAQKAKLQKEKAEEEAKLKKERSQKEAAARLENIAQCREAYETAKKKGEGIGSGLTEIKGKVVDFADGGVMVMKEGDLNVGLFFAGILAAEQERVFIYTSDTDYATNETFKDGGYLYKRTGNYKYTTVAGGTNSVPAYKATTHKKEEIDPKTYLANKSLSCCHVDGKEFGVRDNNGCHTESGKTRGSYSYF